MLADIMNFLFNGTLNGAVLSLIALGYSLVYGVGHVMNLAHGSFFMLTGYLMLWFVKILVDLIWISVFLSILIIIIIGALTYIILIKPLQDTSVGVVLITFGLAFFLEQYVLIVSGTESYALNDYMIIQGITEVLGYKMLNQYIFFIIASLIIVSLFVSSELFPFRLKSTATISGALFTNSLPSRSNLKL
ncbi:hypothetical protein LCGC14_1780240 [marine sediment metagenome]|uniref:Branched-chain amino acid ABC transporter permease n=1 Tax=marine sediment metagenome TaxID=412755 RepID=A0A0F9HIA4_9ZZZZ